MKIDLEKMREKFMSLSANRADELAQIYGGHGAESLDRAAQWRSMLQDAPANRTYMMNALGLGHDQEPVEEAEPSADDKAAEALLKNPTLSPREITVEAGTKPEAPKVRARLTNDEIAKAIYGNR